MFLVTLLSLTTLQPIPAARSLRSASNQGVQVQIDASQTNARGLQIVTVRLKIDPAWHMYGCAGDEDLKGLRLSARTRDPKTRVDILYPKGNGDSGILKGEVAIQAIVQRAPGDNSPIDGQVDFCAIQRAFF